MSVKDLEIGPYLAVMVKKGGEDMYLHTGARILFKGPGGFAWMGDELEPGHVERIFRSLANDRKIAEFEASGEVDFGVSIAKVGRFRANAFRQRGEVSLVFRHVHSEIPTIESLNLPQILRDLVMQKNGLVLIVGATGSGKSTTLAAMIDHRNENAAGHILTLEEPIEYLHHHKKSVVAQREIGVDTESFSTGMRSAMREAPNVILVGEVRDTESMEYALKFANTGHLCLSTLHSNNAISAIERMISFFPVETYSQELLRIADNLRAIVCQRLVPTVDGKKTAATEVLINTPRIKDLIERHEFGDIHDAVKAGHSYGMHTFDQSLIELFEQGRISAETAVEYADSRNNVSLHIRMNRNQDLGGLGDVELERI
ncbi:MAG: type IV pili twitching motility protein PilT [Haliea sp.]|nr:type IV pili twitching motility protein PilT [Haliea sp.]|tara:strand:+ start:99270 stop:100385 length:1116 start_codon:yes stop_codon:yes gene_type:complete